MERPLAASRIVYRPAEAGDLPALRVFLAEAGWAERVRDAERFRLMVQRAGRTVVALEGDRIVGFARALFDGVSNGYISMVAVAGDRRRRGIGRALVERLVGDDPRVTWVLRAGHDSAGFWRALGFAPSQIAMERVRREPGGG